MSDPKDESVPPVPPVPPTEPSVPSNEPHTPPQSTPGGYAAPSATPQSETQSSGYSQPSAYSAPGAYSQPGGYGSQGYAPAPSQPKTLSLIGMIAGIVGVVGSFVVFIPIVGSILGLFIPAAAIVLGFLGKKREGQPARALWLTAIITGFVGIAIALIALIGWIALFAVAGSESSYSSF